jgi:pimeloyl-ACP methyl ester carboxylesterase
MKRIPLIGAALAAVGGVLLLRRRVALKEDIPWDDAPRPGSLIDIEGYGVHYIDRGEGLAIVLVHGFGGQTYAYRKLIPALARDHRVIAVDLKGYGYSMRDATTDLSHTGQVAMLRALWMIT